MLEGLFKGILNISLYATVVAVAVMFIKVIFGKRLSPNFHYGIWECHKRFLGISKPKHELYIDDLIPYGV